MIQTVDNFYLSKIEYKSKKDEIENYIKNTKNYYAFFDKFFLSNDKKIIGEKIDITLKDYQNKEYPNNTFFSFFKDEEKIKCKNEDDLIISIKKSKNDKDEDI